MAERILKALNEHPEVWLECCYEPFENGFVVKVSNTTTRMRESNIFLIDHIIKSATYMFVVDKIVEMIEEVANP